MRAAPFCCFTSPQARLVATVLEMLARHPEVQHQCLTELHAVIGGCGPGEARAAATAGLGLALEGAPLPFEQLMGLEYFKCLVHECLRMYPPSVSVAPRTCAVKSPLGQFTIPAGTAPDESE